MNEADCTQLLEAHGIKPTANRIVVVRELARSLRPATLAELEAKIQTIDKSNIFRALTLFKEQHLVHVIEGGSEGVRYELVRSRGLVIDLFQKGIKDLSPRSSIIEECVIKTIRPFSKANRL